MAAQGDEPGSGKWRNKLYEIIFESDTSAGKMFDIILMLAILSSIIAVMMESVESFNLAHGLFIRRIEWFFTAAFTLEYIVRLAIVKKPLGYAGSFLGIVDLLAIVPTYLGIFIINTRYLRVIRAVRLLRVFRIFKLGRFITEGNLIARALRAAVPKITVFLGGVGVLVLIMGTMMYMIEGSASGFTSIPKSIYWAIVTITTVGYGDIAPATIPGQALASIIMIMGYSIIAVPTGLVTVEFGKLRNKPEKRKSCPACFAAEHDADASFCNMCGSPL